MRIALALAAVALAASAASAAGRAPAVELVRAAPVTVAGRGYARHARVSIVYRSGTTLIRRGVVTSATGTFRLVLSRVSFTRCAGLHLTAGAGSLDVRSCAAGGRPSISIDPGGLSAGSRFVPGERIALTARVGDTTVRSTTAAGPSGRFSARLAVPHLACAEISVSAIGSLGSRASFTSAAPECLPP